MSDDIIWQPSNPWPEPLADSEQPTRVWRAWSLCVDRHPTATEVAAVVAAPDVQLLEANGDRLTVRIRSDDPITCDAHEVIRQTREVLFAIDARWPLRTLQGVPKERWLILR